MKETEAARAVLLEVLNALGAMRDDLVIVGGWVPDLLYPESNHMGSLDVDLAVSPKAIGGNAYSSICERLTQLGYTMRQSPTRFFKQIPGTANPIKIDLITGLYVSQQRQESILVDEIRINALRGVDLAFEASETITLCGRMPDGSVNQVTARLVAPEAYILIKAITMDERTKDKDAYDIAFVLNHYKPSLANLAMKVHGISMAGIGKEALELLRAKFRTFDSVGPVWAGRAAATAGEDAVQFQRAAYEDATELFRPLDTI
ncbi:MAG: GSU2403 family nucleotidyltransferase fold protein [Planctomycetota bacterium]|nr:GSU2403 family nucleotidyltransferase fold protein [Planctomycetota bacterium]